MNMILIYLVKNKYIRSFVIALFLFTSAPLALAQGSLSLSVSPAIFEMNASPDQTWESKLRIINNNPFELTVFAEVVNFRPAGEDGSAHFIPVDPAANNLANWITIPNTALVIPAEETLEIPIRIDLPEETPPGGHYASVLVGTKQPGNEDGSTRVETSQVVSSLIFLRVAGDIVEQASIRSFRPVQSVVENSEVTFEMRIENTGNVHVRPEGEITIYNMWGQERGVIPVNQSTLFGNILSESIRTFRFTWEGEWSPLDIGRYTVEATLAYGEDGRQFTDATASFWIIPWRIILGILLVLTVIGSLVAWLLKLYVRRMFAVAGIEQDTLLQQQLAQSRRRPVSVTAPIEAGILDLRSRLSSDEDGTLHALGRFISEYKLFFLGTFIVLIAIYLFSWFVGSVSEDTRAFEVTIDGTKKSVIVDSEALEYEEVRSERVTAKRDLTPVRLINRSGVNGQAAEVAVFLESFGYTIESVSTELNQSESQTVIVHDPALADEALELSALLDNALLSPFVDESLATPLITVFVGDDVQP